jgi:hypothetical protein
MKSVDSEFPPEMSDLALAIRDLEFEVAKWQANHRETLVQLVSANEEIERLRKLVAEKDTQLSQIPCRYNRCISYAEAQAEIEKLKKDVVHWREARRSCIEAGDMMKAEIDRLRENERLAILQFREQEAEIERLHEISRPGSCECSTEDACRFARERDEARALLREAHQALSLMPRPTKKLHDLRSRIREQMGEG